MNSQIVEPYLHLVDVTADAALICWGAFHFRSTADDSRSGAAARDDHEIIRDPRGGGGTVGADSSPYGEAEVTVRRGGVVVARASTVEANHVWVTGLRPDTEYEYEVRVNGVPWAAGERRDWVLEQGRYGLRRSGRRYHNVFRTHPDPDLRASLTFAVLGDFGVGVRRPESDGRHQQAVARALLQAVEQCGVRLVLTTGDNVYRTGEDRSGGEDSDWFFAFYQPYRYLINRIPVYPAIGNHDSDDTEGSDDRRRLEENFYIRQRFGPDGDRASLDPGLFYRFPYGRDVEFVAIDTTLADGLTEEHFFDAPRHQQFLHRTLMSGDPGRWRIPFSHHPPYCAGPSHPNSAGMVERLCPLLRESGVRVMFSGHEHNFQHAQVDGVHYVVSGAGGKLQTGTPTHFDTAHTLAWAAEPHFLIVHVDADRMTVRPVQGASPDGGLADVALRDPRGRPASSERVIRR